MRFETSYTNLDWNMRATVAHNPKQRTWSVKVAPVEPSASFIDRPAQLFSRETEAHKHARAVVGMQD